MKKSRAGSPAGEALVSPPVATVQVPLPLLRLNRIASGGAAPKNVPDPARRAYRGCAVGEVALGGRRLLVPRLRARSVDGHELELRSGGSCLPHARALGGAGWAR